jgi:hypothetical protein
LPLQERRLNEQGRGGPFEVSVIVRTRLGKGYSRDIQGVRKRNVPM